MPPNIEIIDSLGLGVRLEPFCESGDARIEVYGRLVSGFLFQRVRIGPGDFHVARLHGHHDLFGHFPKVLFEGGDKVHKLDRLAASDVVQAVQRGRLFGSVTSKEIAEKIKEEFGVELEKKKIIVEDIRQYGTYAFTVKVYQGIQVQMYVFVGE